MCLTPAPSTSTNCRELACCSWSSSLVKVTFMVTKTLPASGFSNWLREGASYRTLLTVTVHPQLSLAQGSGEHDPARLSAGVGAAVVAAARVDREVDTQADRNLLPVELATAATQTLITTTRAARQTPVMTTSAAAPPAAQGRRTSFLGCGRMG